MFTNKSILTSTGSGALSLELNVPYQLGLYGIRISTGDDVTTAESLTLKLTDDSGIDDLLFSQNMAVVDTTTAENRWNPVSPVKADQTVEIDWANSDSVDWKIDLFYEVA
jgi:hypothetical protein